MLKKKNQEKQNWLPDYYVKSVHDIDFDYLHRKGIKAVMFDLDHTILVHGSINVGPGIIKILKDSGVDIYIATNRRESHDLDDIKSSISAKGIMFARGVGASKPSKRYYELAMKMTKLEQSEVAMVGDRLVQDVWGANRAGLTTIMVAKFGYIRWYDQILTVVDRMLPIIFKSHYKKI